MLDEKSKLGIQIESFFLCLVWMKVVSVYKEAISSRELLIPLIKSYLSKQNNLHSN